MFYVYVMYNILRRKEEPLFRTCKFFLIIIIIINTTMRNKIPGAAAETMVTSRETAGLLGVMVDRSLPNIIIVIIFVIIVHVHIFCT